jgi:hypothetical protein
MDAGKGRGRGGRRPVRVPAGGPARVSLNLSLPADLVVKLKAAALLRKVSISAMVEAWAVGSAELRGVVCFQRAAGDGAAIAPPALAVVTPPPAAPPLPVPPAAPAPPASLAS